MTKFWNQGKYEFEFIIECCGNQIRYLGPLILSFWADKIKNE